MSKSSKDRNSWNYSGVRRRDFRHTKGDPEINRKGKKKNTKRWCRGKPGIEHTIGHRVEYPWAHADWCTACGKKMKHYYLTWPRKSCPVCNKLA